MCEGCSVKFVQAPPGTQQGRLGKKIDSKTKRLHAFKAIKASAETHNFCTLTTHLLNLQPFFHSHNT